MIQLVDSNAPLSAEDVAVLVANVLTGEPAQVSFSGFHCVRNEYGEPAVFEALLILGSGAHQKITIRCNPSETPSAEMRDLLYGALTNGLERLGVYAVETEFVDSVTSQPVCTARGWCR